MKDYCLIKFHYLKKITVLFLFINLILISTIYANKISIEHVVSAMQVLAFANNGADIYIDIDGDMTMGLPEIIFMITQISKQTNMDGDFPDKPVLNVSSSVTGLEDQPIPITITVNLSDTDGSEVLQNIIITNLPGGARFSAGEKKDNGQWEVPVSELNGLSVYAPANSDDDFIINVYASSKEKSNDLSAITKKTIKVNVEGDADPPKLIIENTKGLEDMPIPLTINVEVIDKDSEVINNINISNIPTNALLSNGTFSTNGNCNISPEQLDNLTITSPPNSDNNYTLTISVTSKEISNGYTALSTGFIYVEVEAVPDLPEIEVQSSLSGKEDEMISLSITVFSQDNDGSEIIQDLIIEGITDNAKLTKGIYNMNNNSWIVPQKDLNELNFTPSPNSDKDYTLTIMVNSIEKNNQKISQVVSEKIYIDIESVPDTPIIIIESPVNGFEDIDVDFSVQVELVDTDDSEDIQEIVIEGLPDGATLSYGNKNNNGWTIPPLQLNNLQIISALNSDEDYTLTVTATTIEKNTGEISLPAKKNIFVNIEAVADSPVIELPLSINCQDNKASPLNIESPVLTDKDNSEFLGDIILSGFPYNTAFSPGTRISTDTYTLTVAQLEHLSIIPSSNNDVSEFDLLVSVDSIERENGDKKSTSKTMKIYVDKRKLIETGEHGSFCFLDNINQQHKHISFKLFMFIFLFVIISISSYLKNILDNTFDLNKKCFLVLFLSLYLTQASYASDNPLIINAGYGFVYSNIDKKNAESKFNLPVNIDFEDSTTYYQIGLGYSLYNYNLPSMRVMFSYNSFNTIKDKNTIPIENKYIDEKIASYNCNFHHKFLSFDKIQFYGMSGLGLMNSDMTINYKDSFYKKKAWGMSGNFGLGLEYELHPNISNNFEITTAIGTGAVSHIWKVSFLYSISLHTVLPHKKVLQRENASSKPELSYQTPLPTQENNLKKATILVQQADEFLKTVTKVSKTFTEEFNYIEKKFQDAKLNIDNNNETEAMSDANEVIKKSKELLTTIYEKKQLEENVSELYDIQIIIDSTDSNPQGSNFQIAKNAILTFLKDIQWDKNDLLLNQIKVAYSFEKTLKYVNTIKKLQIEYPKNRSGTSVKHHLENAMNNINIESDRLKKIIYIIPSGKTSGIPDNLESKIKIENFIDNNISIHCIVIGDYGGEENLRVISNKTGGSFYYCMSSEEVIEKLYDLIWLIGLIET